MESAPVISQVLALFARGEYAEAEPLLGELLAEHPDDAEGTHYLGFALRETGRRDAGDALLRRSMTLGPERAEFHYHMGNAHDADGDSEKSSAAYRRALELRPGYPHALLNLGLVLQNLGRVAEAELLLKELVAAAPRSPSAHLALARLHDDNGQQGKAIPLARIAAALSPKAVTYAWLSSMLRQSATATEAADAQEQALAAARDTDAITWMALAESFQHDPALVLRCLRQAIALEPGNAGAAFMLAAHEGRPSAAAPDAYIARIYDNYADHFDEHLVNALNYRAPRLVHEAVISHLGPGGAGPTAPLDILDLGCGTGLAAPLMKPLARSLIGVDLSPKMIAQARRRNLYDELEVGELTTFLAARRSSCDLLLAVDVLIHLGDLTAVFARAAAAVRPGGLFAFSIETHDRDDFFLQSTGRFAYGVAYLRRLAADNGFVECSIEPALLRNEGTRAVVGSIAVLRKD